MTYQEFLSGPARAAAVLGAQPPRLEPDARRLAQRRPPRAGAWSTPSSSSPRTSTACTRPPGSRRLVALHGRIADVVCLSCRRTSSRARPRGSDGRGQPRVRRCARRGRDPARRRRRARRHGRVRGARLRGLRRDPQARRGVLRRERPATAGAAVLRRRRRADHRRRARGGRLVADGDERPPVRPSRREGRRTRRDRQPWRHPRRRPGDGEARRRVLGVPRRARVAPAPGRALAGWYAQRQRRAPVRPGRRRCARRRRGPARRSRHPSRPGRRRRSR